MPRYTYECSGCADKQEVTASFDELDEKSPVCEYCGMKMDRVISATNFILNGSGWARDGYGNGESN